LAQSLTGSALTAIFVCISQAPANATQSKYALEFGHEFSKMTIDRLNKVPVVPLVKMKNTAEASLKEHEKALKSGNIANMRFVNKRLAIVADAKSRLVVLGLFK